MSNTVKRAAVLGHPIVHSMSPILHSAAYEELGLADWDYAKHDVDESQLPEFLASLGDDWAGLSLTMPLKQSVMPLLHHIEPLAQVTGAVNTVLFSGRGAGRMLVGTNTDVYGIVTALREGALPEPIKRAAIIGAGATASSAMAALAELGCASPVVYVRNLGRTATLRMAAQRMGVSPTFEVLRPVGSENSGSESSRSETAASEIAGYDAVVSTLPPFAADELAGQIVACGAKPRGILLDVAYDPAPTALIKAWREATGIAASAITGERMLLHQAVEQVRLMTGKTGPVEAMSLALDAELARRRAA